MPPSADPSTSNAEFEVVNPESQPTNKTAPPVSKPALIPRPPLTDPQSIFHYTDLQRSQPTRANDPYEYLAGFGNRHASEVIPGTLPAGQNNPQENRFGLYTEGITYSAFAARREVNRSTYMYRVRPAAVHSKFCGRLSMVGF